MKNKIILSALLLLSFSAKSNTEINKLTCDEFNCLKCWDSSSLDTQKCKSQDLIDSEENKNTINFNQEDVNIVFSNKNIVFAYMPNEIKAIISDFLKTKNLNSNNQLKDLDTYLKRETNIIPKEEGLKVISSLVEFIAEDKYVNQNILDQITQYKSQLESNSLDIAIKQNEPTKNIQEYKSTDELLSSHSLLLSQILTELKSLKEVVANK